MRQLLEPRLIAWADLNDLAVAVENQSFDPAKKANSDGMYLRAFLLMSNTDAPDLAGEGRIFTGTFQIDVVGPRLVGSGPVEAIAEKLDALFPVNLLLSATGFSLQTVTPLRVASAIDGASNYALPTSFTVRGDSG